MFPHVKRVEFVGDREVGSEALATLKDLCAGWGRMGGRRTKIRLPYENSKFENVDVSSSHIYSFSYSNKTKNLGLLKISNQSLQGRFLPDIAVHEAEHSYLGIHSFLGAVYLA